MNPTGIAAPLERKDLIPALIGAGVSIFFARIGLFAFFFLAPLGFLAFRHGRKAAWNALLFAVAGNALAALAAASSRGAAPAGAFWGIAYFAIMACVFVWIAAPPPNSPLRACGAMRLIAGSCAAALLLIAAFFRAAASPGFLDQLGAITDAIASWRGAAGADVVQAALLSDITPEMTLEFMAAVMLRGGALFFSALLFFACRQFSFLLARLFAREKPAAENLLAAFRAPRKAIWALSGSLLLVVLASAANIGGLEILIWNILVLCGIMYLAQGLGILQFFLARAAVPPFLRLLLLASFFIMLLSPGINAVLLGGVALLGIAENWVPLRAPETNGTPSTPQAGD